MFACPILRQQSTEGNPPMRLICGHVISKDALTKLCNGNKYVKRKQIIPARVVIIMYLIFRLKCPYCPVEQRQEEARHIYF